MDQLDVLLALGLMGRPNGYLNGGSGRRHRRDLPSCHGPQPPRWRAHLYFSGSSSLPDPCTIVSTKRGHRVHECVVARRQVLLRRGAGSVPACCLPGVRGASRQPLAPGQQRAERRGVRERATRRRAFSTPSRRGIGTRSSSSSRSRSARAPMILRRGPTSWWRAAPVTLTIWTPTR